MDFNLPYVPERTKKTRENGLTMVMDKGLSVREAEDLMLSSGDYSDVVKFGFGTAMITKDLEKKIKIYKEANVQPFFGGTLFEAFIIRDLFDSYRKMLDKYDLELAEISDGSMIIPHDEKIDYINKLSDQVKVLSEVGSKKADIVFTPDQWVSMMKTELEAGAWKVIAEARESGTVGIYNKDGSANIELVNDIIKHVKIENVLWEAPNKPQQVWFIKLIGANVNLGNVAPAEVIALEALRQGLRGDTFYEFLPDELKTE